ncbi:hypothetical protein [Lacinutrix salivirga]
MTNALIIFVIPQFNGNKKVSESYSTSKRKVTESADEEKLKF